ncbi:MAG: Ldh family oxidoreductase [Hyphomicrobiaceae bacterium]
MSTRATIGAAALQDTIGRALVAAGTGTANAACVARALTLAEIDGEAGHGLSRVPSYTAQVRAGKVKGDAAVTARRPRPAALVVDAGYGFAYPAFDRVVSELPGLAREMGIAAAAVVRSHHAGALGLVVERLAEAGCLALMFANTPSAMAAWGGRRGLLGTNPVAFAAPVPGGAPVVVDLALTEVARGKILAAAQKGEAIPAGWAVDETGAPTTDAKAALQGTLLPAGGAKGAALALMVEVLAAAVTGSKLAFEATSFLDDKGGAPDVGQFIIAIDAGAFAGSEVFGARIGALAAAIVGDGARLPGARKAALRAQALRDGVGVDARLLAEVEALAEA